MIRDPHSRLVIVFMTSLAIGAALAMLSNRPMRYELGFGGVLMVLFLLGVVLVFAWGALYG